MENRFSTIILLFCLILSGCNGSDKKSGEKRLPDPSIYELSGPVKSVKMFARSIGSYEPCFELRFDADGRCTRHANDAIWEEEKDEVVNEIERNTNGQITRHITKNKENGRTKFEIHYFYDEKGRVSSSDALWESNRIITEAHEYNDDNSLKKTIREERHLAEFLLFKETYLYRNYKFDNRGNWIERECVRIVKSKEEGETSTSTSTFAEKREILYY